MGVRSVSQLRHPPITRRCVLCHQPRAVCAGYQQCTGRGGATGSAIAQPAVPVLPCAYCTDQERAHAKRVVPSLAALSVATPARAGGPYPATPPEVGVAPFIGPTWDAYRCVEGTIYNFTTAPITARSRRRFIAAMPTGRTTATAPIARCRANILRHGLALPRGHIDGKCDRRFLCFIFDIRIRGCAVRMHHRGWPNLHSASVFEPGFGRWHDRQRLFHPGAITKSSNGNAFSTSLSYRRIRRGFVLRTATPKMSRRRGCAAGLFLPGPISCRTQLSRSWTPMCG